MERESEASLRSTQHGAVAEAGIIECTAEGRRERPDRLTVEEPMEIRIVFGPPERRAMRNVAVTMRTPGQDEELATGFLFTECLIADRQQIESIECRGTGSDGQRSGNVVLISLRPDVPFDAMRLQRNFFSTSSCGVCGKASLEAIFASGATPLVENGFQIPEQLIFRLPEVLREKQASFATTGSIHGTALVDHAGTAVSVREDVGRHNAVDKVIGRGFLDGKLPLGDKLMVISGRASFEIVQKSVVAGIPVIVAVGAPSSLAVETAKAFNQTLVGFASQTRFNIYSAPWRIA